MRRRAGVSFTLKARNVFLGFLQDIIWKHSLRGTHCKGNQVPSRKQVAHRLPGTKGGLLGPKRVSRPLLEQNCSHRYNKTVVAYIHKEEGMRSGSLCALLWRILTWCASKQVTLKASWLGSRCTEPIMGGSGPICLPTGSHLGQNATGLPMQENHSDCSRLAYPCRESF